MRAFRFSLQRVLDVKTLAEKQQRQRVADAERRRDAAQRAVAAATALLEAAVAEGNDGADPALRALNWRRRGRLLLKVQTERTRLEQAEDRLQSERSMLVQRHKDRRSLELLSENKRQRHRAEEARREQNTADDLFVGRFAAESGREANE